MEVLAYSVDVFTVPSVLKRERVLELVRKAASEWNKAMHRLVWLMENTKGARINISFGKVNRTVDKDRIAECHRVKDFEGRPFWKIILANDVLWDASKWWQFWAKGDFNLLAAITHEFGHVFLDDAGVTWHSANPGDVMWPACKNSIISEREADCYRERFALITNPD